MREVQIPDPIDRSARRRINDQILCLRFGWLLKFYELNGFIPSNTVIGTGWGGLSRAAVPTSLDKMEERGWIERVGGNVVLREGDCV